MRVKVIAGRSVFLGFDDKGNRVTGTPGDELSVPNDLSKESATRALKGGFLEAVKEVRQTATKAPAKTATKAPRKTAAKVKPKGE